MPTVKVGDINMYYEIHGEGAPLLLIMGFGMDLTGWMFQVPEFSNKYRVLVFDNRGVGRTDAPDKPYSIRMMADDTAGLMDELSVDRAHIVGLSMGGFIAQELAISHPERVKSLVLATTEPAFDYHFATEVIGSWVAARTEGVTPKTYFSLILPFLFTDKFFDNADRVRMALDTMAANPHLAPAHGLSRQFAACIGHSTRDRLKHLTAPTLVLVGREDILLPVKLSGELASLVPESKLVVLEGGGHGFNAEIADKFNQAVLAFLAEHP